MFKSVVYAKSFQERATLKLQKGVASAPVQVKYTSSHNLLAKVFAPKTSCGILLRIQSRKQQNNEYLCEKKACRHVFFLDYSGRY